MSEFRIEVVRVGEVMKHPNADSLSMTLIHPWEGFLTRGQK